MPATWAARKGKPGYGPTASRDGFVFTATEGGPLRWHNFAPAVSGPRCPRPLPKHLRSTTCAAPASRCSPRTARIWRKREIASGTRRFGSRPIATGELFPRARQEVAYGLDETYRNAASASGPTCALYATSASPEQARPFRDPFTGPLAVVASIPSRNRPQARPRKRGGGSPGQGSPACSRLAPNSK
jgi:hypothetical protein